MPQVRTRRAVSRPHPHPVTLGAARRARRRIGRARPPFFAGAALFFAVSGAACLPAAPVDAPDAGVAAAPFDRGVCQSTFVPTACRAPLPEAGTVLDHGGTWRNIHGGGENSDEVDLALPPALSEGWTAEPNSFHLTGPVFDRMGNAYASPVFPHEDIAAVSIAPDGTRRFTVPGTGDPVGGAAPLVLDDPAGGEVVYLGLYSTVVALNPDGTERYRQPTGLVPTAEAPADFVFGLNHHPQTDTLLGVARDGKLYAVSRATGEARLSPPYQIPGAPSPTDELPFEPGGAVQARLRDELAPLMRLPADLSEDTVQVLLGGGVRVANFFSIDAHTGAVWVAATAPDGEDGAVDGESALGALYRLRVTEDAAGMLQVDEVCHASFEGGSASTPALTPDGARVLVGDGAGNLLAIDRECHVAWRFDVGAQIVGSITVDSDSDAFIAATQRDIVKVVLDDAGVPQEAWRAAPTGFSPGAREQVFNLNLATLSANFVAYQAGVGRMVGDMALPRATGVGLIDRETGVERAFLPVLDETVAVMSIAPQGWPVLGNSPVRRAVARALAVVDGGPPLRGGLTQMPAADLAALSTEIACAGHARAALIAAHACGAADRVVLETLSAQAALVRGADEPAVSGLHTALATGDMAAVQNAFGALAK